MVDYHALEGNKYVGGKYIEKWIFYHYFCWELFFYVGPLNKCSDSTALVYISVFHVAQLIWQQMEVLQMKFMTVSWEFSFHRLCLTGQTCGTTPFHMPYYAILFIEGNTLICKSYMKSNESCRAPNFPCTIIAAEMIRCREGIRQPL